MNQIRFRIDYFYDPAGAADKLFILHMLYCYLVNCNSQKKKANKKDFLKYMKNQVEMFGACFDSQFGEAEYDLTTADALFAKWFMEKE